MDASEPEKNDEQEQDHVTTHIHIYSPDNHIAGRDFIEVNIHLGEKSDRKRADRDRDATTAAVGRPIEIRQLLKDAAAGIRAAGK